MVVFETLTYKNFESVGNHPITIQLNRNQTTLISGKNGSGKCVDKDTKIRVSFKDPEIKKLFEEMIRGK